MATSADIGYGTTFTWNTVVVGEVTRISPVSPKVAKQDATVVNAPNAHKEWRPGLIDPGDIEIEGWADPDDTGQTNLLADMNSRTQRAWIITFPASISSAIWTGNGYCIGCEATGDVTPEGLVAFRATIAITGLPTLTP